MLQATGKIVSLAGMTKSFGAVRAQGVELFLAHSDAPTPR